MDFAINHICAPGLAVEDFFALVRRLGSNKVEIRNDIPDVMNAVAPDAVKAAAQSAGVEILSINALYPFNVWSGDLPERAVKMADYAQACGAKSVVMCPLNDGTPVPRDALVTALRNMAPILRERGLTGLVEPLGFPISSMRTKAEAIAAIEEAEGADVYRIMHDTFHHHLAGETELFADWTGLVHVSGVTDPDIAVDDMLDAHRGLVDEDDRLENIAQLRALEAAGYAGPVSFEPFAEEVHALADPEVALRDSIDFVASRLKQAAPAE